MSGFIRVLSRSSAEAIAAVSADIALDPAVFSIAYPIFPYSLAIAEGTYGAVNCLHRITHNLMVHAPTVRIANPDLYTKRGELVEM